MNKIKIGIVGATGYTGLELLRILVNHPFVEISFITSETYQGQMLCDVQPQFIDIFDIKLISVNDIPKKEIDLVFLALPHGVAMDFVKEHHHESFRIIDLSGDFRLQSAKTYEEWYQKEHRFQEGIGQAVYGLAEINRSKIKDAKLVANPGCYPTSAILGIYPALKHNLIKSDSIIVDAKSGVTGAGGKPKLGTMFGSVNENFKAYGVGNHRHTIEIQEVLNVSLDGFTVVQFTPHLLPVDRGILSTIYLDPINELNAKMLQEAYIETFGDEAFIRLRNEPPEIKNVARSNYVDINANYDSRTNRFIVITAIDNLMKGASGQAVQNMNIMFGFDEKTSLNIIPTNP